MRTRSPLIAAGIAVTTALALAACSGGGQSATTGNGSGSSSLNSDSTLNVGLTLEPTDLDVRTTSGAALDQILIDNVYQGLVGLSPSGKIVNVLAKSRTVSSDRLTYTFTLNKGVAFSDGTKLTAADVAWSLGQVKSNASYVDSADFASVSSITAPNADTVEIRLDKPDSSLLYDLAGRAGLVLEQGATNDLKTTAIGTGPYKLTQWNQGDSITFTRNASYWGPKAGAAKIVWHYYTDTSAAVNAVTSGAVQVQTAVDPTLKSKVTADKDLVLKQGDSTDKYTLAFNNATAPLDDLRVRQAIRQAIDPKAVIAAIGGAGVPMGGPIPKTDPGYQDLTSIDAYDPSNAKKLLAEAGQSNLTLTLTTPNIYSTTLTDVLKSELAKVGITLTVNRVEFTTWLSQVFENKNYQLSLVDHNEAHDFGNWANPQYYFGYDNKQVQELYAQSQTELSQSAADADLAKAAKIVSQDAAADWLYNARYYTAVHTGVSGFPIDSNENRINLVDLKLGK